MRTSRRRFSAVAISACGLFSGAGSLANTNINAEGVSDYTYCAANEYAGTVNILGADEATGFYNGMTQIGSGWTQGSLFVDAAVFDTDFLDPNVAGGDAADNDNTYFDNSTAAIGFFSGHGTCDDRTQTPCTTGSQCGGGICPGTPPSAFGSACISNTPRRFVVSSPSSSHGDTVFYGNGHLKWGETSSSGAWGGAGTNGGLMAAFMVNSCGASQWFIGPQVVPMFAGLAQLNLVEPTGNVMTKGTSDNRAWSARGSTLATYALANPSSAIRSAWSANLDSAPSHAGSSCPDQTTTYTYGGGHSINGCGGMITIAFDSSQAAANWDVNTMTWLSARSPSLASRGNGYQQNWIHCNYDCITYPFTK